MKKYFLIILSFLFLLPMFANANESNTLPSQVGIVQNVEYIDLDENSLVNVKQIAEIKILTGEFKNKIIELDNMLTGNPYYDIKLKKGNKVILHLEDDGEFIDFSIENIKRSSTLVWLSIIFCALLVYVGKKKGIFSLVSIVITVFLISHFLAPLILMGINPVFATSLVCIMSTALTMYLVGGFNAKSTSATLGAILSLVFAGVLSLLAIKTAYLTGFAGENTMFLYTAHPELDFVAITICTMVLATLGAVMDIAMSIASTINEIFEVDNSKSVKELFKSGMNVGRDVIGTMANTLILVYMGGSLPLILLAENIDMQKFINLNQVVTEISAALIGSIAIVICVPITAIVTANLTKKMHNKENATIKLDCV